jgi:hypothetical protein
MSTINNFIASQLAEKEFIMAQFTFSKKYSTKKLFNIETENFEYRTLEDLYLNMQASEEPHTPFVIRGVYINNKGLFEPTPVIALDDCYVNLPAHLTETCNRMIQDPQTVVAINQGHCGFRIEKYHQKKYNRDCYSVEWVDL